MSYRDGMSDPFADSNSNVYDSAVFGEIELPVTGRIVARPISIYEIWPDRKQPRRAIPLAVRGQWDGRPDEVPEILRDWKNKLEAMGYWFRVGDVIQGHGSDEDINSSGNPVLDEYLELVHLAAGIHRDGLVNPITVVRQGDRFVIETGERRWLAHHLLKMVLGDEKYGRIAAVVVNRGDIWRQAAENGQRRPLNAVGMARQLALLIMDMYTGDSGVRFDAYEDLVLPGESDRRFYAQVADGQIYGVKRGMSQRVLAVTGLKNKNQLSQYRSILEAPDWLWEQADVEDRTEGWIRTEMDKTKGTNRSGIQTKNQPEEPTKVTNWLPNSEKSGELSGVTSHEPDVANGVQSPHPLAPSPTGEGEVSEEWDETDDGWNPREGIEAVDSTDPIVNDYLRVKLLLGHLMQVVHAKDESKIKDLLRFSPEEMRLMVQEDGESLEWIRHVLDERITLVRTLIAEDLDAFEAFMEDLYTMAKHKESDMAMRDDPGEWD